MKTPHWVLLLACTGVFPALARAADSFPPPPSTPDGWYQSGREAVAQAKALRPIEHKARNVIFFVGDGMGVSTVTAARILSGQLAGRSGEESVLSFERLPYLALSKTYSVNQQTSDSAPTMTAMVTGVKTNDGELSVNQNVARGDCAAVRGNELTTILELAERRGMSTGVVSTARLTHATPAANYAKSPERDWEDDTKIPPQCRGFPDIARQLIEFDRGDGIEVALGGGRDRFLPATVADPEDEGARGRRADGRNLTAEWLKRFGDSGAYVWNKAQFDRIDPSKTKHLLGLFERSHMKFEHDRAGDKGGEPSLAQMTAMAIEILATNPRGYYLQVEGGRIDHAHHAGNAYRALTDTLALAEAVKVAMDKTDPNETLIIVTADHSHVFTIAGYPKRGNNILGKVIEAGERDGHYAVAADGGPYTTLSYANGRGVYRNVPGEAIYGPAFPPRGGRHQQWDAAALGDAQDPDFHQEALVPTEAETHGGEDVAIYASGPQAHLLHGTMEQHVIFHIMKEALGL